MVGLSLSALLAFGALGVDVGMQRVADAQVQSAIEAGALGGAAYLDRTLAGIETAKGMAVSIANANQVVGGWVLTDGEVEVGIYTDEAGFAPVDADALDAEEDAATLQLVNAVRIRSGHRDLDAILAGVAFGRGDGLETTNEVIAQRKPNSGTARSVPCFLPLAIPDCKYADYLDGTLPAANPPPVQFVMSNANIDNVGWGDPISSAFGTSDIKAGFAGGGCHEDDLEVGETMYVKNGQNTSVVDYVGDILNGAISDVPPSAWDHAIADRPARDGLEANCPKGMYYETDPLLGPPGCAIGKLNTGSAVTALNWITHEPVIAGPVALVTPSSCDNTSFTGAMPISGFAWAMIYDARTHVTNSAKDDVESKNIWVQLDFIQPHDMGGDVDPSSLGNITGYDKPTLVTP